MAEGRARPDDEVPRVIRQRPDVDWRPRMGRPFELSLFHSLIDSLEHPTRHDELSGRWQRQWCWSMWLGHANHATELVTGLKARFRDAPEPERSDRFLLIDEWLTAGMKDNFLSLRTSVKAYRELSLTKVQRREADALEYPFGEEALLALLLRTVVATMIHQGVLLKMPPSQRCPVCDGKFVDESGRRGEADGPARSVLLVCFMPCSHWMVGECWRDWREKKNHEDDWCPMCNEPRLALVGVYPGHVIERLV